MKNSSILRSLCVYAKKMSSHKNRKKKLKKKKNMPVKHPKIPRLRKYMRDRIVKKIIIIES